MRVESRSRSRVIGVNSMKVIAPADLEDLFDISTPALILMTQRAMLSEEDRRRVEQELRSREQAAMQQAIEGGYGGPNT